MSSKTKTALITGATGGIGRALVSVFKDAGYHVIATDIGERPLDMDCGAYVSADLTRYAVDEAYASEINSTLRHSLSSQLNVLINNAATQILGGVASLTRQDWQSTLNINLLSTFFLAQSLLAELKRCKGSIINIGSIHTQLTKKGFVAYATSKAALSGMTRAMSVDLGGRIRVNALEPAAIETDMLIEGFKENHERYKKLKNHHPALRIGTPIEVANAALWLASDACIFIHGSCIRIDGGISNRLHDPS